MFKLFVKSFPMTEWQNFRGWKAENLILQFMRSTSCSTAQFVLEMCKQKFSFWRTEQTNWTNQGERDEIASFMKKCWSEWKAVRGENVKRVREAVAEQCSRIPTDSESLFQHFGVVNALGLKEPLSLWAQASKHHHQPYSLFNLQLISRLCIVQRTKNCRTETSQKKMTWHDNKPRFIWMDVLSLPNTQSVLACLNIHGISFLHKKLQRAIYFISTKACFFCVCEGENWNFRTQAQTPQRQILRSAGMNGVKKEEAEMIDGFVNFIRWVVRVFKVLFARFNLLLLFLLKKKHSNCLQFIIAEARFIWSEKKEMRKTIKLNGIQFDKH